MSRAHALAKAARGFVGVPFRLHGRDPVLGMDCVGLLVASLRAIGARAVDPVGYALRNRKIDRWLECADQSGLMRVSAPLELGDVMLVSPGPLQHHILIADTSETAIHAHAGLRRVVRQPLATDERIQARWRLSAHS
ncbi:MAG: hypothetical protein AAF291_06145 [Pseudomonadota bacterium]